MIFFIRVDYLKLRCFVWFKLGKVNDFCGISPVFIWLFFMLAFTLSFVLIQKKSNKRKNQGCTFLATPVGDSTKEKELATLKQLFLFNVPSHSLRFTPKKWGLHSTQHRFARWSRRFSSFLFPPPCEGGKGDVLLPPLWISKCLLLSWGTSPCPLHKGETERIIHLNEQSDVESPVGDRPLVEEREEFFALSREEEKAVWA